MMCVNDVLQSNGDAGVLGCEGMTRTEGRRGSISMEGGCVGQ